MFAFLFYKYTSCFFYKNIPYYKTNTKLGRVLKMKNILRIPNTWNTTFRYKKIRNFHFLKFDVSKKKKEMLCTKWKTMHRCYAKYLGIHNWLYRHDNYFYSSWPPFKIAFRLTITLCVSMWPWYSVATNSRWWTSLYDRLCLEQWCFYKIIHHTI